VTPGAAFTTGAVSKLTATARLTLHGITRTVSVPLSAQRDAADIRIAGSIPISFADWDIAGPKGYGALGSLADHGMAEFLLVLRHG
jgi:YceI-like domain